MSPLSFKKEVIYLHVDLYETHRWKLYVLHAYRREFRNAKLEMLLFFSFSFFYIYRWRYIDIGTSAVYVQSCQLSFMYIDTRFFFLFQVEKYSRSQEQEEIVQRCL